MMRECYSRYSYATSVGSDLDIGEDEEEKVKSCILKLLDARPILPFGGQSRPNFAV